MLILFSHELLKVWVKINLKNVRVLFSKKILKGFFRVYSENSLGRVKKKKAVRAKLCKDKAKYSLVISHSELRYGLVKIKSKTDRAPFNEDFDIVWSSSVLGHSRLRHGLVKILSKTVKALFNEDFEIVLSRLCRDNDKYWLSSFWATFREVLDIVYFLVTKG
ncbi:hypothetical protein M0802_011355 [Mischocyttarus mexicanus]|nr:hypothetical protein M0802_011355 [Mischocyttarus mexicanus]